VHVAYDLGARGDKSSDVDFGVLTFISGDHKVGKTRCFSSVLLISDYLPLNVATKRVIKDKKDVISGKKSR
jgi:hypothetical protein